MTIKASKEWQALHKKFPPEREIRLSILRQFGEFLNRFSDGPVCIYLHHVNGIEMVKIKKFIDKKNTEPEEFLINISFSSNKALLIDIFRQFDAHRFVFGDEE